MKLPSKVAVKGVNYKVKICKAPALEGREVSGLMDPHEKTIYINKALSQDEKWITLLHEVGHATLFEIRMSSNDGWVDPLVEEMIVDNLADVNFQFLKLKVTKRTR